MPPDFVEFINAELQQHPKNMTPDHSKPIGYCVRSNNAGLRAKPGVDKQSAIKSTTVKLDLMSVRIETPRIMFNQLTFFA